MVGVFERVYEVGPVFRAEPHDTARHLAQYTSLDVELGFIADHRDVMAVLRDVLAGMVGARSPSRLPRWRELPAVPAEIPAVHFAEALKIAGAPRRRAGPGAGPRAGAGRVGAARARLRLRLRHRLPDGEAAVLHPPGPGATRRYSNGFDLLFRGLELVTGGQRLHRYDDYLAALAARGEPSSRTRATWRRSGTACRRTAASRSGWSGSWPG